MPFLLLLVLIFCYTLSIGDKASALFGLCLIIVALLVTYSKTFRDSIEDFF